MKTKKKVQPETQLGIALAACRSIRFACTNAARFQGAFSLNDILSADRLAKQPLDFGAKPKKL